MCAEQLTRVLHNNYCNCGEAEHVGTVVGPEWREFGITFDWACPHFPQNYTETDEQLEKARALAMMEGWPIKFAIIQILKQDQS